MKLALIGAGERGMIYSRYAHDSLGAEIAAAADLSAERREYAKTLFGIREDMVFADAMEMFRTAPDVDALIVASMDRDHYLHAMAGLERGWDLLLEKPISPDPVECLKIWKKAEEKHCNVTVCHVLRYSPFFMELKKILDSGRLGRIAAIEHTENIGNFHMAHSFVRGNWRNDKLTSPIILQKSCHDMDILLWLTGKRALRLSSAGDLRFFTEANAPAGSTERCLECPVSEECRFDASKAYLNTIGSWPSTVLTMDQTKEGILRALREGIYGRCVFRCDNNVCDHQSTVIEFEDGITACFTMSGFTNRMCRTIHIMCENGELWGDDGRGEIRISPFCSHHAEGFKEEIIHIKEISGAHGGGDEGLMNDFADHFSRHCSGESRSSIRKSIESHLMACAAEESRLTNQSIDLAEYTDRQLRLL